MTRRAGALLWAAVLAAAPVRADDAAAAHVVLRWRGVPGASEYEIEIATDRQFARVVLSRRVGEPTFRWPEIPAVAHWWRVRSVDAEGRSGVWSGARAIAAVLAAPQILAPAADARLVYDDDGATVAVSLAPNKVLKEYAVEVAADPGFGTVLSQARGPSTTLRVALPGVGAFHLRSRGVSVAGEFSEPGPSRRVAVVLGAPRAVEPAPGAALVWAAPGSEARPRTATLRWKPLKPAVAWRVEVTRPGRLAWKAQVTSRSAEFPLAGPGRYAWRVRAVDAAGTESPPSDEAAFDVVVSPPQLLAPAPGAAIGVRGRSADVDLAWEPVDGAASYQVAIGAEPADPGLPGAREVVASPTFRARGLLAGAYAWRVTARDAAERPGAPSETRSFVLGALAPLLAPALRLPAPGAVIDRASLGAAFGLSWDPVPAAARYEVALAPAAPGAEEAALASSAPLPASMPRLEIPAPADGVYAWRVRGLDEAGAAGSWTAPARFYVGRPPVARAEIAPAAARLPADGRAETEIVVQLFDAEGRPVPGADATIACTAGTVGPLLASGDDYRARYVAPDRVPETAAAEIAVEAAGVRASARLLLVAPGRGLRAGPRVGWRTGLGQASSLVVGADLAWTTPWLDGRLVLAVRFATFDASATVAAGPGLPAPVAAWARVFAVGLGAVYEVPVREFSLYAGLGPELAIAAVSAGADAGAGVSPGAFVAIGAARPLGPGEIVAELSAGIGALESPARLRTGGLVVAAGYRISR